MMRTVPVRVDGRRAQGQDIDPTLALGTIFWMGLTALTVIAFAL